MATALDRGTTASKSGFRREVGVVGLLFTSLGSVIGSGWLLGALHGAQAAGPASLISWLLAGAVVIVLALVYAELGAAYPVAGGSVSFPIYAFGGSAGMVNGWMAWLGTVALAPIEVEAALTYLTNLKHLHWLTHTPKGSTSAVLTFPNGFLVAVALVVVFAVINVLGVRSLARTNTAAVWWKTAIPVLTLITLMVTAFHSGNFSAGGGFAPFGVRGIFAALPVGVVFALQGFEQATQMGAEARNPSKDLPRAIIGSVLIGVVVYFLLEVAFVGSLDPANLAHGWANPIPKGNFGPYATIASGLGLTWLAGIIYADAFISPAGTGLIYTATSSRISYAMGRNDYFPSKAAVLSERGIPVWSIGVSALVGIVMLLPFPGWESLVNFITSASALMYAFAPLALGALRRQDPDRPRPYRLPAAGFWGPVGFVMANLIFYWGGWKTNWRLMAAIAIGAVVMAVARAFKDPASRPALDWRHNWWMIPWLAGLTVISAFGQYGTGHKIIPFWIDIAVVAVFSLAVYRLALYTRLPHHVTAGYVADTASEMELE
ncbi:APC family permease [Acidiferrimicrobium sp. IK]|uniref:APC family permease n=1 Tax=Acidiferrimicrobium sp. IK TaxID=2871700 RepID=UPI0021CB75E2|nr:APC family permease [Acidiferrimicrobium sp. IK]MCU4185976.1 APC family permease [Acidiferrimicrobium sp. IK]